MSLFLAVKRSYRYFIPASLLNQRKLVRQLYIPVIFYLLGLDQGVTSYASPAEREHFAGYFIVGVLVLFCLGKWAGIQREAGLPEMGTGIAAET